MAKRTTLGTTIEFSTDNSTSFTAMAQVFAIGGPNGTGNVDECPALDDADNFIPKVGGRVNAGTMPLSIYGDNDNTNITLAQCYANRTLCKFRIEIGGSTATFPGQEFSGIVNSISHDINVDDVRYIREYEIEVSGDPGWDTST